MPDDPATDSRPTRTRLILVAWLCGLSGILYLDRICMGQAVVPIQNELGLTNSQMSLVLMSFTLAYGLFAVPAGRWGDRSGPRSVLSQLVLWWSVFTALTGAATGLITLVLVRFLFGAAEAGAFPNAAKVLARWFPVGERGRVQGVMLGFSSVGSIVAPAATAHLIDAAGWRWVFLIYGSIGVAWAVGFWLWFRDDPATHRGVNTAELAVIHAGTDAGPQTTDPGPVPWGAVFTSRGVIVLSLIMVFGAFFTYFFYSWFQKYLNATRGVENVEAGNLTSLVMAGGAVGMLLGGWLADRVSRSRDPLRARRYLAVVCYLTAAACLFLAVRQDDALALAWLCAAAFGTMHVTLPNWWSFAIPQCGRHTATVFGLMNGLGVLGAMASQGFVGVFADWQESRGVTGRAQWDPIFDVYVGVLLCNAVAWWLYRFTWREHRPGEHGRPHHRRVTPCWPSTRPTRRSTTSPPLPAGCSRPPTTAPPPPSSTCSTRRRPSPSATWRSPPATRTSSGSAPGRTTRATRSRMATASTRAPTAARPGPTWASRRPSRSARSSSTRQDPNIVYVGALGRLYGPNESAGCSRRPTAARRGRRSCSTTTPASSTPGWTRPTRTLIYVAMWEVRRDGYDSWPGGNIPDGYDSYDPVKKWGPHAGIYKTTDGGRNWKKLTKGLPSSQMGRIGLDIYRKDPNVLVAVVDCQKIGMGTPPKKKAAEPTAFPGIRRRGRGGRGRGEDHPHHRRWPGRHRGAEGR
jgi:MFS transporter, ACS family, glucarate transporter